MKYALQLLSVILGISLFSISAAPLAAPPLLKASAERSNVVGVRGKVLRTEGRWWPGTKVIVTDVTLRVDQASQSDVDGTLTFIALGGELPQENLRMNVNAIPIFRSGQSVVVSLDRPRPETSGMFMYRAHLDQPGEQR